MPELKQYPQTGSHLLRFCGDTIEFLLSGTEPLTGRAFLCTNIGNAAIQRDETILRTERHLNPIGQDWNNIPMQRVDEYSFRVRLALTEVGHFECKCGIVDEDMNTAWARGDNIHLNVISAAYCASNTVYCAFVRQFGENKNRPSSVLPEGVSEEGIGLLDRSGYSVIPGSGTFRALARELDHIVDRLKCRIIHLLPVNPVPTTYARMGRFGSPYASQDFTAVDPALAEFDTKASPLEQFCELVDAVHRKNAFLFLDIAINHTGWASKLQEEHPDWFVRDVDRTYVSPGAWGVTWGDLIELDHKNPPLWSYLANVFLTWCKRGVDGFRCDAGYMIPEPAWKYIVATVRREFPDTVFLLEGLGGSTEVTRNLLDRANMDWAYSELFQNYSRQEIEGYLGYAWGESVANGLMIHYAETHDNNRLAASGERYAMLRTALSAMASSCGAFGFTNGVEWFAKEKVDVHQASALNWGAEPNQIDYIARLNAILSLHPAFFNGSLIRCIDSGSPAAVVIIRADRVPKHFLVVAMNLDCNRTTIVEWDSSYATFTKERMYDLISGRRMDVLFKRGHKCSMALSPGQVVCLSPDQDWVQRIDEAVSGGRLKYDHIADQQAADLVLRALTAKRGTPVLLDDDVPALVARLRESPEGFLQDLYPGRADIPFMLWKWPEDLRREVMVAPGRSILVTAPGRFRFHLVRDDGRVIVAARSIPCADGRHVSIVPPLPAPDRPLGLKVSVFVATDDGLHRDTAVLMLLPHDVDKAVVSLTRDEFFRKGRTFLQTNGRGAALRVCLEAGRLTSRYDALLLANLHPEVPVDRHIMWRQFHFWMIYRARRQLITNEMIDTFHVAPDGSGVWCFKVPVGNARVVGLMVRLAIEQGRNAVRASFHRYAYTESGETIADAEPVFLIISPDLEDRNFHCATKASEGPQNTFPAAVTEVQGGFEFRPAPDRILRITASQGVFRRSDEWSYMNYQEVEAERGLDPNCDLYSPGYFKCLLNGNDTLHLVGQVMTSPDEQKILPVPKEMPPFEACMSDDLETVVLNSLRAFIAKRGELKTVIAGFPWFLDWGRDTLIFVRGLLLEPSFRDDVKKILLQFAALSKDGTICNMISGSDTGNRDTSDAPLWLFVAIRDLCRAEGDSQFLKTQISGRGTLISVLEELAEGLLKGTPNGIVCDQASGLIFSPAHFTWMDTNYPAGTPREGYPVEIQALWYAALRFLAESLPEKKAASWSELADRVRESFLKYYPLPEEGYLSDCLHCKPGTPASDAVPDDHLRPNQLLAITLGLVGDMALRRSILINTSELLVPGGIRSLADRPVKYPLPVCAADGTPLNDPNNPYQGHYCGDEDTRRKVAYHNGTAWTWQMPLFPEAYFMTHGTFGRATAVSLLSSMAIQLDNGCIMHMPEILDGDWPHKPRGCDAQAWGLSEYYRVWKLLHPAPKSPEKPHE